MCGVVARFTNIPIKENDGYMAKALNAIRHRGPDGHGSMRCSEHVELGHHRLSIISPNDGAQPMADADTGIALSFNGEIYNYRELRQTLEGAGHTFRTSSDTEVLLRCYIEYGVDCLHMLNGMFGFVIYDLRKNILFGARDHMGVKPLYYHFDRDRFIAASEPKAILADPGVSRKVKESSLFEYMTFGFVAGSETLFRDIHELEPGHYFIYQRGNLTIKRYWGVSEGKALASDENQILGQLENLLDSAVQYHMIADVPVALLLSGGIDSSLVGNYGALHSKDLVAYCLRMPDEHYDESRYARMVTEARGMDLRYVNVTGVNVRDCLDEVTWYYDEPLIQTNTIGLYRLCQEIHNDGTKVLLSGEGGDELFGGYDRYKENLAEYLGGDTDVLTYGRNKVAFPRIEAFWPGQPREFPYREQLSNSLGDAKPGNRFLLYDQRTYLVHLLQRPDRVGLACGIEIRVPFLDYRVVEFANTITPELKIHDTDSKYILRKLAAQHFPRELVYREKQAFDTPIALSLKNGAMNAYFKDLITNDSRVSGIWDIRGLHNLLNRLEQGESALWRILWQALCVEVWLNVFKAEV